MGRVILVSLAVLLALAPTAEAAKRRVPQGFFGAMYDRGLANAPEDLQDAQTALMARSGVESIRTVFSWRQAQPEPGRAPDFDATDAQVARATRRGLRILPVVINTPVWARKYPDEDGSPPLLPSDYAAYLSALAGRYGSEGSFWTDHPELPRRPLLYWQIWNEPHLQGFWTDPDETWPEDYTELLRVSHDALAQADPQGNIVLAGLADFVWNHLRDIYREGGHGLFDVVAINFYTSRLGNYLKAMKRVRKVMRSAHDSKMQIWLTEITWPAAKGRRKPRASWQKLWLQSDRGMARRLSQSYDILTRARRSMRLARVYWYTWSSAYRKHDLFDFGGLLQYRGGGSKPKRRPALRAYQRSAKRYEGCAKTSTARCR
jgi:hypothetical protein